MYGVAFEFGAYRPEFNPAEILEAEKTVYKKLSLLYLWISQILDSLFMLLNKKNKLEEFTKASDMNLDKAHKIMKIAMNVED